jgi:hypothetical protein
MLNRIKSAVTSPVFWVALVSGVILATAFSAVRRIAKPVADKIPKNDAA